MGLRVLTYVRSGTVVTQYTAQKDHGEHQEHGDAEVRQYEAKQHEAGDDADQHRNEACHQAEVALRATASIFDAENDTPERLSMDQVEADEVGHLDRGELPEAPDLARDLDGDDLTGPTVSDHEEVDLVDDDPVGVDLRLLGVEVDDALGPDRPRRSARRWCRRVDRIDGSFQREGTPLPLNESR